MKAPLQSVNPIAVKGRYHRKMILHGTRARADSNTLYGHEIELQAFQHSQIEEKRNAAEQELVCLLLNSLHIKYCQTYIVLLCSQVGISGYLIGGNLHWKQCNFFVVIPGCRCFLVIMWFKLGSSFWKIWKIMANRHCGSEGTAKVYNKSCRF